MTYEEKELFEAKIDQELIELKRSDRLKDLKESNKSQSDRLRQKDKEIFLLTHKIGVLENKVKEVMNILSQYKP